MVGMTRAHIADPHIVQKIMEGREDDIRPCVGATYCLDRIYAGGAALCVHNPSTGRELSLPHQISRAEISKQVVVVGADPGGLEAARVAALRGHRVTVLEAAPDPGGQVRLCAQSPRRREMIGVIDWRMAQCAAHDVAFHFNTYAEAEDVIALSPDMVVIATGGMPEVNILDEGADLAVSGWDILSGDATPSGTVLIYDDVGDHVALQTAEACLAAGAEVELMSRDRTISPEVMGMNFVPYMRALQPAGVKMTIGRLLKGLARQGNRIEARIGSDYVPEETRGLYDMVVVNQGIVPLDQLYFDLKPLSRDLGQVDYPALLDGDGAILPHRNPQGAFDIYRIGDAVTSRNIHAAIHDALRMGRRM